MEDRTLASPAGGLRLCSFLKGRRISCVQRLRSISSSRRLQELRLDGVGDVRFDYVEIRV